MISVPALHNTKLRVQTSMIFVLIRKKSSLDFYSQQDYYRTKVQKDMYITVDRVFVSRIECFMYKIVTSCLPIYLDLRQNYLKILSMKRISLYYVLHFPPKEIHIGFALQNREKIRTYQITALITLFILIKVVVYQDRG